MKDAKYLIPRTLLLLCEERKRRGWKEQDLPGLDKSDKTKVALARRMRPETTLRLDETN